MVRELPTIHRPGVFTPGNVGELEYPIACAGGASETTIREPLEDDPHEARRRQLLGKPKRWRKEKQD